MSLPPDPLLFSPHYHTRVWGGRRMETDLGRALPDNQRYGESWELSDRPECQSVVGTGSLQGATLHELWTRHRREVFGEASLGHPSVRFPLLIKVLDCSDVLSLQVHPPASKAASLGGEPKSEMWHIAAVEPGATLYAGLRAGVTPDSFERALAEGSVAQCVHTLQPAPGDSLMVPSGRLHALGAGLLVFEIQQNSDTTYRVFDWNRLGQDGSPRALHVHESLQCIDFEDFEPDLNRAASGPLRAECEHFRVEHRSPDKVIPPIPLASRNSMRLIMALSSLTWAGSSITPGSVALWPASAGPSPDPLGGEWLEIEVGAG